MATALQHGPTARRGGATRAHWIAQQKGRKAVLYVIKLYGNGSEPPFYKVGITFDLASRFRTLRFTGYKWRTVARYSGYNAGRVYDLEQRLHAAGFATYVPLLDFSGKSECYTDCAAILAALPASAFILKNTETLI